MGEISHKTRRLVEKRPRDRLSAFLRARFKGYGATQRLAKIMDATPKAAENAMLGHWPCDLHFAAIVRHFGKDVWDAVFAPEVDAVLSQLQEEERRLAQQLAEIRARRRQAQGLGEGGSGVRAEARGLAREASDD